MKQLLTFALMVTVVTASFSQVMVKSLDQEKQLKRHRALVNSIQRRHAGEPKLKTTSIDERLIAASRYKFWSGQGLLMDTFKYKYSGNRKSKYDYERMIYNEFYSPMFPPEFSLDNQKIAIQTDTLWWWQRNMNNNQIVIQEQINSAYTSCGKIDRYDELITWAAPLDEGVSYVHSYDAQDRLNEILALTYNNTQAQWDTVSKKFISYNVQNLLASDSLVDFNGGIWTPSAKYDYTYDGNGNLTGILSSMWFNNNWYNDFRHTLSYYSNNKLQLVLYEMMNNTTWENYLKDTFAYNSSSSYSTNWEAYMNNPFTGSGWIGMNKLEKHMNAQGLPDTMNISQWDFGTNNWVLLDQITAAYDTFGDPLFNNLYYYDSMGTIDYTAFDSTTFYYQLFNTTPPTTGVPDAGKKHEFKIFPNPVRDELQVTWTTGVKGVSRLELRNMAGQLVCHENLTGQAVSGKLPMRLLVPGVYLFSARDSYGNVVYHGKVFKQ